MNRRGFLGRLGLGSIAILFGNPRPSEITAGDALTQTSEDGEDVEIRVYGGSSQFSNDILARRTVRVRPVKAVNGVDYMGPRDLKIVLMGPIVVTAITSSVPKVFRIFKDETELPSSVPVEVRYAGDMVTIELPERLLALSYA